MKKTATELKIEAQNNERKERAYIVAEQVKTLFMFCAQLIPDKEMLKDVMLFSSDKVSTVQAMAPILMAFGEDYEEAEMQAKINTRRACALYELVVALEETEEWRAEFKEKSIRKMQGRNEIRDALGL